MSSSAATTEATRQVVQRFYDRLKAGDFAGVMECFHPDIEVFEPDCLPYGGVYRGVAGLGELFSKAPSHLDVNIFSVEAIVADGDRAVGFLHSAAVRNGTPVVIAEESQVRDGKIVRVRVFHYDPTIVANAAKS